MDIFFTIADIAPESGGPSRSVPSIAKHLSMQNGMNVSLLALDSASYRSPPAENFNFAVNYFPFDDSRLGKLRSILRMRGHLSDQVKAHVGSSIIHDQGIWQLNNHAAVAVAKKTATPIIVSLRGMIEPWSMSQKKLKKKIAWNLYQERDLNSVNLLHATAQQEAQNAANLGLRKPVAIIPNGVEVPQWRKRTVSMDAEKTIFFLSRVHPKKGLLNLVSAWQQVKELGWKIVVAGPDEAGHKHEVMSAINAAGLQDCFEFIGPIDDTAKWDWYFNADLFVLPTFSENFGIVIAEALACGVPVITTTGTPWQELNTHNCGWWVDVGVEPLVEALRHAISLSVSERAEMGRRGRRLIEEHYSWGKISQEMIAVYAWLLGKGPKPDCIISV
ncbi:MAG: glycosyltransferase [Chlorobium sp.]|nr:glycosyltransferase [Chlorobium sp.]